MTRRTKIRTRKNWRRRGRTSFLPPPKRTQNIRTPQEEKPSPKEMSLGEQKTQEKETEKDKNM